MDSIFKRYIDGGSDLFFKIEVNCSACRLDGMPGCDGCYLSVEDDETKVISREKLNEFSITVNTLHEQFIRQKYDFKEKLKSLENDYNKILNEINNLRKAINDCLDELEKNTKKELDTLLATMRTSIQTDIDHCTESIKTMTCVQEDWQSTMNESTREYMYFSGATYEECLDHSLKTEAVLKEMKAKNEVTLTFTPDTLIQQTLSTLSGLGQILQKGKQSQTVCSTTVKHDRYVPFLDPRTVVKSKLKPRTIVKVKPLKPPLLIHLRPAHLLLSANKLIKLKKSKTFRVRMTSDSHKCLITGICETAAGLLILDTKNRNMKLLDRNYKVVAHCKFPGIPESMCSIDSSLVAVTVWNSEVHFIRVTNGQLVHEDRTIKPQHFCKGIAHHKGNLYITSGTALYKYTTDGRQVCKIYEKKSCYSAVTSCAVSSDGFRIYVANQDCSKLLTLSKNGRVISTLTDPALKLPTTYGHNPIHVTGSGQVLVCNADFNTVLQVDGDGRRKFRAEVVKGEDDLRTPLCIYSTKSPGTLVVGMMDNDNIMVFTSVS